MGFRRQRISAFLTGLIALGGMVRPSSAQWTVETVDTSGAGYFTSLKADSAGNLHAAYVPETFGHPLRYAFWDRALKRWFTMEIAKNASFSTLILDSQDRPRISYSDFGTGLGCKLEYAVWNGSWKIQPIDPHPGGVIAYYTSVALDKEGKPILTYYHYADPNNEAVVHLGSIFWTGTYWTSLYVDRGHGSGKFNSLAIDSNGRPQVAYANVTAETQSLRYAIWDGKTWHREIIEGATRAYPVYSVSMVLDKNDVPHIVYSALAERRIKYATRRNGRWVTEVVDSYVGAAEGQGYWDRDGIVLDAQGNPYISYFDKGLGELKVAHRVDGKWQHEVVDRNMAGLTSSPAIADGKLWVSYAALYEQSFKVAHRPLEPSADGVSADRRITVVSSQ
jgi:hypothetical protein